MVDEYQVPMLLDQATISNTNHYGHPPHVDNLRFDSVWRDGKRVPVDEELSAARSGAYILWRTEKTSYRSYSCSVALSDPGGYEGGELQFFDQNYSASIALTDPEDYGGGELEFFGTWGSKKPTVSMRLPAGSGMAFCGCQRSIHAVTGAMTALEFEYFAVRELGLDLATAQKAFASSVEAQAQAQARPSF
eukprot:g24593.t1